MTVLATAGHVDHGKSTLVNFLTGQETDRLKEEKLRGLTISLGYTYFDYEEKRFSIVDVPGHSDYFKNTISGFSNVDGVLFCIDSTQGWSQQSEDHFLSLLNLGINNLLFFLTKTDKKEIVFGKNELENKEMNLPMRRIVNAGSVGEPRHGGINATYVIYDDETSNIDIKEVSYDINRTCKAIIEAGLPQIFAWRLSHGFEFAELAEDASHVCER